MDDLIEEELALICCIDDADSQEEQAMFIEMHGEFNENLH